MATVLFIDDEASIRRAVSAWLTRKGHVVHEASTAEEARQLVEIHGAALQGVFIDLWLGTDSGVELFTWLLAHHPALGPRVAFMTGDLFDSPTLERKFDLPVLGKPFELSALETQIARWEEDGG